MLFNPEQQHVFFLGALALLWAEIERLLDLWVEEIHEAGGAEQIQALLPPNLDREIDYLKKALKVGLIDPEQAAEASKLLRAIHRAKGFRHDLIHSVTEVEKGRIVCDNWRVRGAARMRLKTPYTVAQRLRHYERTYQLTHDLRAFLFEEDVS